MKTSLYLCGIICVWNIFSVVYGEPPSVCTRCLQGTSCKPPDCFCCREDLQLPIPLENIPQIVFFTFDDAVTDQVAGFYKKLFDTSRKNPNGCPISMTLFISHDNTKYRLVQEFYEKGMEIASHSVTHSTMNGSNFFEEAKSQKQNLAKLANIPITEIRGWRSPFLKPTGDLQPDTLKKLGYSYDATLTFSKRSFREKPPGPFTLDFGFPYECQVKPCPRNKHPGFWEVPVVSLMDYQHKYDCVYVDGCMNAPPDEDAAFQFLWDNFHSYYTQTRMPFGINMHPSWFYYPDRFKAMDRFIQKLVSMRDVYVVSANRMLEWLKQPTPLQDLRTFTPWACDGSEKAYLGGSGVKKPDPRSRPSMITSWVSRTAGVPRRYFTPRVMYPASLYTPAPSVTGQRRVTSRKGNSIRPSILTLTAQELEGRPPLYPPGVLNDRLHRQRLQDQSRGWRGRIHPSLAPRIATVSMDGVIRSDMPINGVGVSPKMELPSPMPSLATQREIVRSQREQVARQRSLMKSQRQQVLDNLRLRRIQRIQRQRQRELQAQKEKTDKSNKVQSAIQFKGQQPVESKSPTQPTDAFLPLSTVERRKTSEKRLQQNIVWKPNIIQIGDTEAKSALEATRKTTPRKVYQETVKVWPLITKTPSRSRKVVPKSKDSSKSRERVNELSDFIKKVESQTNIGKHRLKQIPTIVPVQQSTRHAWIKPVAPQMTAKPRFEPARRRNFAAVTPTPLIIESPLERQRRLQAQHLRRADETRMRQREREERILRQQIQELRQKERSARHNRIQSEFNHGRFVPGLPRRPRPLPRLRPRPIIRPPIIDGPMFRGDILHPSVAQRIAWNRFIRQMLGAP